MEIGIENTTGGVALNPQDMVFIFTKALRAMPYPQGHALP